VKSDRIVVLKVGGSLLRGSLDHFWEKILQIQEDRHVIIIHGGGEQSTELAQAMGHEPNLVHGRRVTSDLDLRILQWAVRGEINTSLVAAAHRNRVLASGMSGADAGMIEVTKRPLWHIDGVDIDFGHVGDVQRVNTSLVRMVLASGFVPVIAPLGVDRAGNVYNVNADTVAVELASELSAEELVFLTGAGGVLNGKLLPVCDSEVINRGIAEGWIDRGMRMKLEAALRALAGGVSKVRISSVSTLADPSGGTSIVNRIKENEVVL